MTNLLSELFEEWLEVSLCLLECGTVQFTLETMSMNVLGNLCSIGIICPIYPGNNVLLYRMC